MRLVLQPAEPEIDRDKIDLSAAKLRVPATAVAHFIRKYHGPRLILAKVQREAKEIHLDAR